MNLLTLIFFLLMNAWPVFEVHVLDVHETFI